MERKTPLVSWLVTLTVLAVALGMPRSAIAQDDSPQLYVVTDIGALSGTSGSRAYGLNNFGQVVGNSEQDAGFPFAWHWQNGEQVNLNTTNHFRNLFTLETGEAFDVSDADQIVGGGWYELRVSWRDEPLQVFQAYVTRPAVISDFGTPFPGDAVTVLGAMVDPSTPLSTPPPAELHSSAVSISNQNHVVGWANIGDARTIGGVPAYQYENRFHAFIVVPQGDGWFVDQAPQDGFNDLMISLGTLDGADELSSATDVNDLGAVVGYSFSSSVGYRGFLVEPLGATWAILDGSNVNSLMQELPSLGGTNSWARAINNSGIIVGDADTADLNTRAFRWESGTMIDLGTLGGDDAVATDINNNNQIVGWSLDSSRQKRATIWEDGTPVDLNDRVILSNSWTLVEARKINDAGQIVGWGRLQGTDGLTFRAFLLDPATEEDLALLGDPTEAAPSGGSPSSPTSSEIGSTDLEPINVTGNGSSIAGDSEDTTPTAPLTTAPATCGAGAISLLPLTMLGIAAMKRRRSLP